MSPLTWAPVANADIDELIEPMITVISQAAGAVDSSGVATPVLAAVDPIGMPAFGDLPQTLAGLPSGWLQTLVSDPLQQLDQAWLTSPFGRTVDSFIDSAAVALTGHALSIDGTPAGAGAAAWLFGDGSADTAAGAGVPATLPAHSVPLEVRGGTDPVIQLAVNGGRPIDAVVDTGSVALAVPWYGLGLHSLPWPVTFGITGFTGGLDYLYATVKVPVDFGDGMVTAPTDVNAVLLAWPQSLANIFNPMYYSLAAFQSQAGFAPAIFGMGPNSNEPPGVHPVNAALPGDLGAGALIDEPGGYLQFGPNPLDPANSISVDGSPITTLQVSIDGGPLHQVQSVVDTGGLYGAIPASVVETAPPGDVLPAGTLISAYTSGSHPTQLYSYTTTATNTLQIEQPGVAEYNTGNPPFAMQPIYISNNPPGIGATIFGNPPK